MLRSSEPSLLVSLAEPRTNVKGVLPNLTGQVVGIRGGGAGWGDWKEKGRQEEEEGEKEVEKRRSSTYGGTDTAGYDIKCLIPHLILTETLACKSYDYPHFKMRQPPEKSELYAPDPRANKWQSESRSAWFRTYVYIYCLSDNVWGEKTVLNDCRKMFGF